ncbi:iron permease FTR1 [Amanita muscaria]
MTVQLFSVPIFFIVFRETVEAAIIIATLLGLANQIAYDVHNASQTTLSGVTGVEKEESHSTEVDERSAQRRLARKLKNRILIGVAAGIFVAFSIGAAFIAVWFTKATDLMSRAELLWEGVFELVACIMIFVMSISMLKLDRAKTKWQIKLRRAFEGKNVDSSTKTGKWALFFLPFITVLREGLEAVVFVGGVSLGQTATSIPIAAIVGLIVGLIVGYAVYQFASRSTLTIFMVVMANLLLLIGAGLFSKAVWSFERYRWEQFLGGNSDDSLGDGPGTYPVQGNVWHLDCCNPENKFDGQGWSIFYAIFGWTSSATYGSILSYVFYWVVVMVTLIYLKFKEGRTTLLGKESKAGIRRRQVKEKKSVDAPGDSEARVPNAISL